MISFKCIKGESASGNTETVNEWLSKLPSLIEDYAKILTANKTGLFYHTLPNKTMCLKIRMFKE